MIKLNNINFSDKDFEYINQPSYLYLKYFVLFFCCILFQNTFSAEENSLSLKEMLLSPGDLTAAHADLEPKCESCHSHFDKSNQTPLCLDCHEIISKDILIKEGFHGKLQSSESGDCKSCHSDHKGREFDIRNFDQEVFNHNKTNFKLENSHKNIDCKQCHDNKMSQQQLADAGLLKLPKDNNFRFKEFECAGCHSDFHQEKLGQECASCHTTESWQTSSFDHSKSAFPLTGQHSDVECSSCHKDNRFEKIEVECQSCHQTKDAHLGIFGEQCIDCHTTENWKNNTYDHQKETGFQLKESHHFDDLNTIQCIDCHSKQLKPANECKDCHKNDDVHQGVNGNQCADCHNQTQWKKVNFKHDFKTTNFLLEGKHKQTACIDCHQTKIMSNPQPRECLDCHLSENPHGKEKFNDCKSCHKTESWTSSIRFNHDFSEFPLTGSHHILACESCHFTSKFQNESTQCVSCHEDTDVHKTALGKQCEQCHDSSTWSHWQFNHTEQTKFPLEGAHNNLKCELCHNDDFPNPKQLQTQCIDCHRDDDVHQGALGQECKQCHNNDDFSTLNF